jgi:protocatechuate 3,4-dioxygenase beta subunit
VIRNVPVGRYQIQIQSNGFLGVPANVSNVAITANGTMDVSLAVVPAAVIRGRVLNSDGEFVSNANVQVFGIVYENGYPRLVPRTSKLTDDRGEYRLFGISPGEYYVGVTPRPPLSNPTPGVGTVRDVRTYFPSTDDPSTAAQITVKGGEEIAGIDIGMRSALHVRVSGRVIRQASAPEPIRNDPNLPGIFEAMANAQINNVQVQLVSRSLDRPSEAGSALSTAVLLPASGEFEFPNVPAGSYDLYASAPAQSGPAMGRVAVDVLGTDVTGLTVVLRSGVEVKGTVTIDGTTSTRPVSVGLQAIDSQWRTGMVGTFGGGRGGPPSAEFSIRSVPQGRYRIAPSVESQFYIEDVLQNGRSIYDSGFDVGLSEPDRIQILVRSGAGAIDGTIVDPSGNPVAGGFVAVVPINHRENPGRYRSATSNAMGKYSLLGIAPGDYILLAWPVQVNGAFMNAAFLSKYEDSGQRVSVAPNSKATIKLPLGIAR